MNEPLTGPWRGKKRLRGKRGHFGKAETLEAEILK
jgi:hypothetical protein